MTRCLRILAASLLSVLSLPVWAVTQRGGTAADYAEIQAFHDRSIEKFNAGDLEGSLADYLPGLRVLHTKSTTITGRDKMREIWSKSFATSKPKLISEIEEMEVNGAGVGAWAYIVCRYAAVSLEKDGKTPKSEISNGRYIALLSKTAEGWKVLLDIDNGAAGAAPDLAEKLKKEIGQ
ncbi:MAG: nuclear transport factor 2 family protein [Rhodospirillaceae bacterium]|nr:nuclear transport factor 2 family protein [Rhodospirillaceae bacterium]